jgi:hypothetical protein
VTDAQKRLDDYMSELSEQAFCAGWMNGLEFALWEVVLGARERYGFLAITAAHRETLRSLSEACSGWIVFAEEETAWVPLDEWKRRFAAARAPSGSESADD